jgi:hypothetical protein
LRNSIRGGREIAYGRKYEPKINCGSCSGCCRDPNLYIDLKPAEAERYEHKTFNEKNERWELDRQKDGSCVYLKDGACSIYEGRPDCCRTFDCRLKFLFGVNVHQTVLKDALLSRFEAPAIKSHADKVLMTAAQMNSKFFRDFKPPFECSSQTLGHFLRAAEKCVRRIGTAESMAIPLEIVREAILEIRTGTPISSMRKLAAFVGVSTEAANRHARRRARHLYHRDGAHLVGGQTKTRRVS